MNLSISTSKFQESIEIYIISFKNYFYVSLGNNFLLFFVEALYL